MFSSPHDSADLMILENASVQKSSRSGTCFSDFRGPAESLGASGGVATELLVAGFGLQLGDTAL